jgi:hypothetical protein
MAKPFMSGGSGERGLRSGKEQLSARYAICPKASDYFQQGGHDRFFDTEFYLVHRYVSI